MGPFEPIGLGATEIAKRLKIGPASAPSYFSACARDTRQEGPAALRGAPTVGDSQGKRAGRRAFRTLLEDMRTRLNAGV